MEKLTLSIRDAKKIEWAKEFAKKNDTSVSRLFESYLEALMAFDQKKVVLSKKLSSLRQPGKRPSIGQIEKHLVQRRKKRISKQKKS